MYVQYSLRCFFHMLFYFFFNDTATTEIYTLSLHDALPISGGRAGLESVRRRRYDLVISDVRMPEGGGEEFYRSAVALDATLRRRFVFITGDTANPEAFFFLKEAQVPVIEKPFQPALFLDAVRRVTMSLTPSASRG